VFDLERISDCRFADDESHAHPFGTPGQIPERLFAVTFLAAPLTLGLDRAGLIANPL
jgi:hypothetical protein